MIWILLIGGVLVTVAALALAARYSMALPGRNHTGPLPPATSEETDLAARLERHVVAIASVPHNIKHYAALEEAARYIERTLEDFGYRVSRQIFTVADRQVRNIEATREPRSGEPASPSLVIGAHYDSYGDAPGANDNGTGAAAVLELARLLKAWQPTHTRLRFVLFVNEEPPYFRTEAMGSLRYARSLHERGEKVRGMINLETIGAFSDEPGSQKYVWPLTLVLPDKADFIAFTGLTGSRPFLHEVVASFRSHTAFPLIGGYGPDLVVPGIGWSDHWAFSKFGFPAVMLTDTALFRYPHYHLPSDTPDKISYDRLARVTKGVERVVRTLAP